jgi:DNA-binding response OmpR family regulator
MSPNGAEVLVADHEPEVGEMSRRYLARAGLSVRVVTSPAAVLGALAGEHADLLVIDLTMPGLDVPAVRRTLTARPPVPAVFLLDRHGVRPRSLSDAPAGQHAFLARPFSPRALVDAATGLLRPGQPRPTVPPAGPASALDLDSGHRRVTVAGRQIDLTRTEFALLTALAAEPGRALSRQRLLAALEAERGKRPTARAIDVYILQLRAKLGSVAIETVHGVGYAFHPRGDDPPVDPPGSGGLPP